MRKIPTVFKRDPANPKHVLPEVNPGCEWVLAGEGEATRKYDGTCVMKDDSGEWWARREVKPGKTPPPNFLAVDHDEATGKTVGWEPMAQSAWAKWHAQAIDARLSGPFRHGNVFPAGTYELCGPRVNGNPEGLDEHQLIEHATAQRLVLLKPDFDYLREWLPTVDFEGVVWHHPDGRMAKLKARDFPREHAQAA